MTSTFKIIQAGKAKEGRFRVELYASGATDYAHITIVYEHDGKNIERSLELGNKDEELFTGMLKVTVTANFISYDGGLRDGCNSELIFQPLGDYQESPYIQDGIIEYSGNGALYIFAYCEAC